MRIKLLLIIVAYLFVCNVNGQDLHNDANAVSTTNEADATTGWTGGATITSDATDTQSGNFSIRAVSTSNNGRTLDYFFNATVGQDYTIRIWAKAGPQVSNPASPAFAAWNGLQGFSVTPINTTQWTEYVFNVTATVATPRIRVYTSNYPTRFTAGNTIFIDSVSILPAGGDTQAPTAPTNLTSSNTTSTTTSLSWTASTDNVGVTDYEVFQDGNSIGFSGGATTFNVSGLTASTSYAFTVFARDAANNISPVSNTENVTTGAGADTQAPTAPTNLTSSNTTSTTTSLSWTASTDNVGVTDYEVFQDGNSIGFSGGATTFNVSGLTASTSYAFTVFARDAANNISPVSNTANVTTGAGADTQAPTAPTNLTSSNTTSTTTSLSWTASTDNVGVTDYEVFQDGNSIGFSGGATTFNVSGLTASTSYAFTVSARDAANNISPVSNTENVTTGAGADTQAPTAPTNLTSSNTTSTTTSLSWTASTDNVGVTDYEVFQDGNSIGFSGGATTFNVTGLTASTSYAFTVFARDAANNISPVSNTANVTTGAGGGGPTDYTSDNANLPTVDWQARDLFADRNVGIGTTNTQGYRLAVAGNVVAEEISVKLQVNWPDYVFKKSYDLPTLEEVENHITEKGYLINMPSAEQVEAGGIELGVMNAKLLEKIEELTLYTLEQEKMIKNLEAKNKQTDLLLKRLLEKLNSLEQDNK